MDSTRRVVEEFLRGRAAQERLAEIRPRWLVSPHDQGQVQFLQSRHKMRVAIPGNGWGKTTAMGMAADMLIQKDDPYNPDLLTKWPTIGIWVCQKFQQMDIIRHQLEEEVWTRPWKWNESKHKYIWPNGGELHIVSGDSSWEHIQGVPVDFVCFDEHPERRLWNELYFRRRGKRKTRYMVAATMTLGLTWFVREIVQPWEQFHAQRGLGGKEARESQLHPDVWVWDVGGIQDNPAMDQDDIDHYNAAGHASDKELQVRLKGGYADFTGEAVFDREALDRQIANLQEGTEGMLELRDLGEMPKIILPDGYDATQIAVNRMGGRNHRHWVQFIEDIAPDGGSFTVWEEPSPDETYVMGADFAAGLVGRDYDALVIARKDEDGRLEQVAEAHGYWGDVTFAEIIYAAGLWYYQAFLVGERQFGLPTLRRLYDEWHYPRIYKGRMEQSRSRRPSDLLGHHRSAADTIIPNMRAALLHDDFVLHSEELLSELRQYQYVPRHKGVEDVENLRSNQLVTTAPPGLHDDLVMAAAYCWHAAREVGRFDMPVRDYVPGTFGSVFQNDRVLRGRKIKNVRTFVTGA